MPRIRSRPRPPSPVRERKQPCPRRLQSAPRCGARTRTGTPCRAPCVRGRARCRMHGGAARSGAPVGNRNAWRHGGFTAAAKARRARIRAMIEAYEGYLRRVEASISAREAREGGMLLPHSSGAWGCFPEKMYDGLVSPFCRERAPLDSRVRGNDSEREGETEKETEAKSPTSVMPLCERIASPRLAPYLPGKRAYRRAIR